MQKLIIGSKVFGLVLDKPIMGKKIHIEINIKKKKKKKKLRMLSTMKQSLKRNLIGDGCSKSNLPNITAY